MRCVREGDGHIYRRLGGLRGAAGLQGGVDLPFGLGGTAEFDSETMDLTGGSHMAVAQVKAALAGASSAGAREWAEAGHGPGGKGNWRRKRFYSFSFSYEFKIQI